MDTTIGTPAQPRHWIWESPSPWPFENGDPWAYHGLNENDLDGSSSTAPCQGKPAAGCAQNTKSCEAQQYGTSSFKLPVEDPFASEQQAAGETPSTETPGLGQSGISSPSDEISSLGTQAESPMMMLLPTPAIADHHIQPNTMYTYQRSSISGVSLESPMRERNRIAADKYRSRQRNANNTLKSRSDELEKENKQLAHISTDLSRQICDLRHMLLEHSHCGCKLVQEYLQNHAANWVKSQQKQSQPQSQQPQEPQGAKVRKRRARPNKKAAPRKSS